MGAEPQPRWTSEPRRLRFGVFELDGRSGELWKAALRARRPVGIAAVAGLAMGAAAVRRAGLHAPALPAFQRITFGRGYVTSARFGPEGQVLYTAAWEGRAVHGFLLRTAGLDTRELP